MSGPSLGPGADGPAGWLDSVGALCVGSEWLMLSMGQKCLSYKWYLPVCWDLWCGVVNPSCIKALGFETYLLLLQNRNTEYSSFFCL